jgi:hypothetical protein
MKKAFHVNLDTEPLLDETLCPYKNLLVAVLCHAIRDFLSQIPGAHAAKYKRDAKAWLRIEGDMPEDGEAWSFVWVCHHLDLNPRSAKEKIINFQNSPTNDFLRLLTVFPGFRVF